MPALAAKSLVVIFRSCWYILTSLTVSLTVGGSAFLPSIRVRVYGGFRVFLRLLALWFRRAAFAVRVSFVEVPILQIFLRNELFVFWHFLVHRF